MIPFFKFTSLSKKVKSQSEVSEVFGRSQNRLDGRVVGSLQRIFHPCVQWTFIWEHIFYLRTSENTNLSRSACSARLQTGSGSVDALLWKSLECDQTIRNHFRDSNEQLYTPNSLLEHVYMNPGYVVTFDGHRFLEFWNSNEFFNLTFFMAPVR